MAFGGRVRTTDSACVYRGNRDFSSRADLRLKGDRGVMRQVLRSSPSEVPAYRVGEEPA